MDIAQKNAITRWIRIPDIAALAVCVLVFALWAKILIFKYLHFGYFDWDLAGCSHGLWNLSHGSAYVSLYGTNYFANHANYIAFLLIPLYAIFPHPLTLLALKILSYVAGGFIFYKITAKRLGWAMAMMFMILFFTYPPNIFAMLFEFDFENLFIVFAFLLFYFFDEKQFTPFIITCVLASLTKENIPLVVATFGIYGLFARKGQRLQWGLVPLILGVTVFSVAVFIITPMLRKTLPQPYLYVGLYSYLGDSLQAIIQTILLKPAKLISVFASQGNLAFFIDLFYPLTFLAFLSPHILFLVSPIIAQNALSSAWTQHTIFYHYAASITPFIFLASVNSLKLIKDKFRPLIYSGILIMFVALCIMNTWSFRSEYQKRTLGWADHLDPIRRAMIKKIPKDAPVIATFNFLPELSTRRNLYSLHNIWNGHNQMTNTSPYRIPADTAYALVDFQDAWLLSALDNDPKKISSRLQKFFIEENWGVDTAIEDIVLFRKNLHNDTRLVEISQNPFPFKKTDQSEVIIDNKLRLLDVEIGPQPAGEITLLPLTFYWKCERDITSNYDMILVIKDASGLISQRTRTIGYAIYPAIAWRQGIYVKERYWLYLEKLKRGEYSLGIAFVNSKTNRWTGSLTFLVIRN